MLAINIGDRNFVHFNFLSSPLRPYPVPFHCSMARTEVIHLISDEQICFRCRSLLQTAGFRSKRTGKVKHAEVVRFAGADFLSSWLAAHVRLRLQFCSPRTRYARSVGVWTRYCTLRTVRMLAWSSVKTLERKRGHAYFILCADEWNTSSQRQGSWPCPVCRHMPRRGEWVRVKPLQNGVAMKV